ncbi:MAG: carboxypeptidase-like regulatory domain-containing protein [Ignavibacteriota bacterium]
MRLSPFLVVFAALLHAQTTPATLDGDIVNSLTGVPIPLARVKLVAGKADPRNATADTAGHFHFDNVPRTAYTVSAEHPAFLPFTPIQIAHPNSSVQIKLVPGAVLYGEVTDPNRLPGTTLGSGIWVEFYEQSAGDVRTQDSNLLPDGRDQLVHLATATVDDRGQYRSGLLGPGTYYVGVIAQISPDFWDRTWRSTYYPHALDLASAKPIQLSAGQQVRADLQVIKQVGIKVGGRISVPSYEPPPGTQISTYVHLVYRGGSITRPTAHAPVVGDRFEAGDLLPGKYTVMALTTQANSDRFDADRKRLFGTTREIEVGERDVADLDLQLQPLPPLTGTVVFGEGCAAAPVPIHLTSAGIVGYFQGSSLSTAEGTFAFDAYPPSSVTIGTTVPGKVAIFLGDREVPRGTFDYPTTQPLRVAIKCSTGGSR